MCLEMFFRGITFDASSYSTVGFAIQNSLPVEVILVTENTNWNNRLPNSANTNLTEINILFDKFTSPQGHKYSNEKLKGLCFLYKAIM
jgi:hypothetical protein